MKINIGSLEKHASTNILANVPTVYIKFSNKIPVIVSEGQFTCVCVCVIFFLDIIKTGIATYNY